MTDESLGQHPGQKPDQNPGEDLGQGQDEAFDQALAQRLASLDPDVADDGFTHALMSRLPARRHRRQPVRAVDDENAWLFGAAAAIALASWLMLDLAAPGATSWPSPATVLAPLEQADRAEAAAAWLTAALHTLLEDHLSALVAAALCAVTLLMPSILED